MRRAQKVTDEAFTYVCGIIRPGLTEMELRTLTAIAARPSRAALVPVAARVP